MAWWWSAVESAVGAALVALLGEFGSAWTWDEQSLEKKPRAKLGVKLVVWHDAMVNDGALEGGRHVVEADEESGLGLNSKKDRKQVILGLVGNVGASLVGNVGVSLVDYVAAFLLEN